MQDNQDQKGKGKYVLKMARPNLGKYYRHGKSPNKIIGGFTFSIQ
jgi:stalled ribosome alternative rescue factor ArfA